MKAKVTVVMMVAVAGGAAAFSWRAAHPETAGNDREPELRWLQSEFALAEPAMRRIAELHRDYLQSCEPLCAALQESEAEIARTIAADKRVTPGLEAALARSNKISAECQRRMVEHFFAVADEMPPASGERYLRLMTSIAQRPGRLGMNSPVPVHEHRSRP